MTTWPNLVAAGALPATLAWALLGVLAGAGGYTLRTSEALSYLSDDPRACANCHVMHDPFDAWQKSSHHAFATCNDCHVPESFFRRYAAKAANGYRHAKAFTFMDFHEPIRIRPSNLRIVDENCRRCHTALVAELPQDSHGGGDGLSCTRCHAGVGHGPLR